MSIKTVTLRLLMKSISFHSLSCREYEGSMKPINSVITIGVIIVLLLSCSKKDEVMIDEESITTTVLNKEVVKNIQVKPYLENKPLIVVSKEDTLKILVRADGAPGMWLGEDKKVHGFYVDLEKMVMQKMGQSYVFVPYYDLGPAVQAIKTGTHHSALAVPDLPDYQSILNISTPFEILHYVTFVQSNDTKVIGRSKEEIINSLHGKKVGVQALGHIYQTLRNIKEIELVEFPTTTKAMEALNGGFVDVVPENRETGIYYSQKNNWNLKIVGESILSYAICTGFSKRYDISIIDRYNKALQLLINDGSIEKLWKSYYGPMPDESKPF